MNESILINISCHYAYISCQKNNNFITKMAKKPVKSINSNCSKCKSTFIRSRYKYYLKWSETLAFSTNHDKKLAGIANVRFTIYKFIDNYSGRFMYGETCVGIICDNPRKEMLELGLFLHAYGGR